MKSEMKLKVTEELLLLVQDVGWKQPKRALDFGKKDGDISPSLLKIGNYYLVLGDIKYTNNVCYQLVAGRKGFSRSTLEMSFDFSQFN